MPNKDVIYIENGSGIPFISFGSRAAFNAINHHFQFSDADATDGLKTDNRAVIESSTLMELVCFVKSLGFIDIVYISTDIEDFFILKNTKALMEAWDE